MGVGRDGNGLRAHCRLAGSPGIGMADAVGLGPISIATPVPETGDGKRSMCSRMPWISQETPRGSPEEGRPRIAPSRVTANLGTFFPFSPRPVARKPGSRNTVFRPSLEVADGDSGSNAPGKACNCGVAIPVPDRGAIVGRGLITANYRRPGQALGRDFSDSLTGMRVLWARRVTGPVGSTHASGRPRPGARQNGLSAVSPAGQVTPVPPNPQYPPGFLAKYC